MDRQGLVLGMVVDETEMQVPVGGRRPVSCHGNVVV